MFVLLWIVTNMILAGKMDIDISYLGIGVCHLVVSFVGCLIGGLLSKKKIVGCTGVLIGEYIIYFAISIFFFEGVFSNALLSLLCGAVGLGVALILVTKKKHIGKRNISKIKYR